MAPPARAGEREDGPPRPTLTQYTLPDERVIERISPALARKAAPRRTGQKVLVWYDPQDPDDVVLYGREGRFTDRAFLAAGLILIGTGIALAASTG